MSLTSILRFSLTLLFSLMFVLSFAAASSAQMTQEIREKLESRMLVDQIPAISVAFADENGDISFYNFGYTSPDQNVSADEHTLFEIGSITKTFTASALMMLMDEQGFTVDTPFNDLLPDDAGFSLPDNNGEAITLKDMMSHYSGIPRLPGNMTPADDNDPYKDYTLEQLKEYAAAMEYEHAAGETFSYSNLAYMLLGYLIEELSGNDFDVFIRERITQPLGMDKTMRVLPEAGSYRLAEGSAFGEPAASWYFDELRGLGELRSTTSDMIRYLMANSGKLDYAYADVVQKAHGAVYEIRDGRSMATGWFVHIMEDDETIVGHGGGTGGYRAFAAFSKDTGRAAVALTNSNTDVADIAINLINTTFPLREMVDHSEVDDELANMLTGIFLHEQIGTMTITLDDGILRGRVQGQPAIPLEQVDGLRFRNTSVGAVIDFKEPENGMSAAFTLRQGGMEFEFIRTDEAPAEPEVVEMSREELEPYAGHFDSNVGVSYEIRAAEGHLSARLTGQPFASVYPEGEDRFFYRVVPATLVFRRGENGEVVSVILYQGGQEIAFTKRSDSDS